MRISNIEENGIKLEKANDFHLEKACLVNGGDEIPVDYQDSAEEFILNFPQESLVKMEEYILYVNDEEAIILGDYDQTLNSGHFFNLRIQTHNGKLIFISQWKNVLAEGNLISNGTAKEIELVNAPSSVKLSIKEKTDESQLAIGYKGHLVVLSPSGNGDFTLGSGTLKDLMLPYGRHELVLVVPAEQDSRFSVLESDAGNGIYPLGEGLSLEIEDRKVYLTVKYPGEGSSDIRTSANLDQDTLEINMVNSDSKPEFFLASLEYYQYEALDSYEIDEGRYGLKLPFGKLEHTGYQLLAKMDGRVVSLTDPTLQEESFSLETGGIAFLFDQERILLYFGSLPSYERNYKKLHRGSLNVEEISHQSNQLNIEINEYNLPEEYEVCLFNVQNGKVEQKVAFHAETGILSIDLDSIRVQGDVEGEWRFAIRGRYLDYTLMEILRKEQKDCLVKHLTKNKINGVCKGIYLKDGELVYGQLSQEEYFTLAKPPIEENIVAEIAFKDSVPEIKLKNLDVSSDSMFRLKLFSRKNKECIDLDAELAEGKLVWRIPTDGENLSQQLTDGRWDIYGQFISAEASVYGRLEQFDEVYCKQNLYYQRIVEEEEEKAILVYRTDMNRLSIVKGKEYSIFREKNKVSTKMLQLKKIRDEGYELLFEITSDEQLMFDSVVLKLRSKENEKNVFIRDFTVTEDENKYRINVRYLVDWDKDFFPLYWDLFVQCTDSSHTSGPIRINKATKKLLSTIGRDYFGIALKPKGVDKIIYPYVTFGKDISFMMRDRESYETAGNKFKEVLSYYIYKVMKKPYFDKRDIWIGFEKFSKTAQDNGYAFFSYVDKNNLHKDFYYVIDKHASDYKEISKQSGNVLKFMSFKYFLMLYASKLLVSSETKRHVHNIRIRTGYVARAINKKRSVFLQHGVTGLKKSDVFKKKKGRGNFNLVIATSETEKEIIQENWKYSSNEIAVTGFARWDRLFDKSKERQKKKIFVMPTWRTWMEDMPNEEFKKSDYYQKYTSLLTSQELNNILVQNDMELVFFLHPKFKQYVSEFAIESSNVKIKEFMDIKVNEEIMESSLMISDYSSVTWDMFYLDKPVIFYQFDHEKYEEYEGSYLDMDSEIFGDRVMDIDALVKAVGYYVENGFRIKPEYELLREKYFKYIDHENSQRIFEIIKRMK